MAPDRLYQLLRLTSGTQVRHKERVGTAWTLRRHMETVVSSERQPRETPLCYTGVRRGIRPSRPATSATSDATSHPQLTLALSSPILKWSSESP